MKDWNALVEADLHSVHVDPTQKEVRIELVYAGSDQKAAIVASGVDYFVLNEMRLSNVVDRVQLFCVDDAVTPAVVNSVFFLLQGRLPEPAELEWPVLQERLSAIRDGSLTLLEIEPVYGASVRLLAKSIKLLPT